MGKEGVFSGQCLKTSGKVKVAVSPAFTSTSFVSHLYCSLYSASKSTSWPSSTFAPSFWKYSNSKMFPKSAIGVTACDDLTSSSTSSASASSTSSSTGGSLLLISFGVSSATSSSSVGAGSSSASSDSPSPSTSTTSALSPPSEPSSKSLTLSAFTASTSEEFVGSTFVVSSASSACILAIACDICGVNTVLNSIIDVIAICTSLFFFILFLLSLNLFIIYIIPELFSHPFNASSKIPSATFRMVVRS